MPTFQRSSFILQKALPLAEGAEADFASKTLEIYPLKQLNRIQYSFAKKV